MQCEARSVTVVRLLFEFLVAAHEEQQSDHCEQGTHETCEMLLLCLPTVVEEAETATLEEEVADEREEVEDAVMSISTSSNDSLSC